MIAGMSIAYARRQSSITRGLRRKKQRPPRIQLPPAPDLTSFEIPPDSDDEYDEEVAYQSDDSLESVCSDEDGSYSDDGEGPVGAESAEDLAQEIDEYADTFDFSLDWDGDQDNGEWGDLDD
ncbi:hypothetical protein PI124_g22176 [Phytophthora idaei]|nr:hypothetical protein PI125_g23954 [Phytophthora idaei]KAG3232745.1 hypothetical protein PI124_g22176 [Phytophthora idaei]